MRYVVVVAAAAAAAGAFAAFWRYSPIIPSLPPSGWPLIL